MERLGQEEEAVVFPITYGRGRTEGKGKLTCKDGSKGRTPASPAPEQQETELVHQGGWHAEVSQVLLAGHTPQVPVRRALPEGGAQQEIIQSPAAGGSNQLMVLAGLVDSLSSLIKILVSCVK